MVTEPFGISPLVNVSVYNNISVARNTYSPATLNYNSSQAAGLDTDQPYQSTDGHIESEELKFMLYCTLAFGLLEIIMIYGKPDFLNVKNP